MSVIITSYSQGDISTYHTDVCRKVWQISDKRYVTKEHAERIGYRECKYCNGEYESKNGSHDLYMKLKKMGEANAD